MSSPHAVLGAAAVVRAQAEGSGFRALVGNLRLLGIALFASFVS
jgi:hypothetical protein